MAAIEGLTEVQNAALRGVVLGDLILIQKLDPPTPYDSEDDEYVAESSDDEDHELDSEDEEDHDLGSEDEEHDDEDGEAHEDPKQESHAPDTAMVDSTAAPNTAAQHGQISTGRAYDQADHSDIAPLTPSLYVVVNVLKDDTGGTLTGLDLVALQFSHKVDVMHSDHSYNIYGTTCVASHQCVGPCKDVISIVTVATGGLLSFTVKPNGDAVRKVITDFDPCIEDCDDGFLEDVTCLDGMIKDYNPEMLLYEQNIGPVPDSLRRPLCPVCMGTDLLREQQALQHDVVTSAVDFDELLEFYGKFSRRRSVLRNVFGGHRYIQFDERKWGFGFNDMLSDGNDDDGESSEFEHWEEANDPNRNVQLRPASEEMLAALPRKQPNEVLSKEGGDTCCIDREGFKDDSVLVELPCGHANFHEECILTWLRQFSNCPICRKNLANADATDRQKEQNHAAVMRRMSLEEALTSLGFEEGTMIHEVDGSMLEIVFSTAREDRAGWRTETAIVRLQAELARPEDSTAETNDQIEENESKDDEDAVMSDE